MLSDDYDQTSDWVYEVWNWGVPGDPLKGVFETESDAAEFEMNQVIKTGGGLVSYYPPLDRYTALPPEERTDTLVSEAIVRLERVERELESKLTAEELEEIQSIPFHPLSLFGSASSDKVELNYDRERFQNVIDYAAMSDEELEVARSYRALARARHLSLLDEALALEVEFQLRELFFDLRDLTMEKERSR